MKKAKIKSITIRKKIKKLKKIQKNQENQVNQKIRKKQETSGKMKKNNDK